MKFDKFAKQIWFEKKIITYVKDDGSNLNAMIFVLKYIICCETLGLQESFNGICFGHAFSKACQYATIDIKKSQVCFNQICTIKFAKMYNLALKIWEG